MESSKMSVESGMLIKSRTAVSLCTDEDEYLPGSELMLCMLAFIYLFSKLKEKSEILKAWLQKVGSEDEATASSLLT